MKVEVLSPTETKGRQFSSNSVFVVVDTFRASTSLATLKDAGAEKIFITSESKHAKTLKKSLYPLSLLVGEKRGFKIKDFDYGNTPSLFYDLDFRGHEIIFTSTTGAKRIFLFEKQKHILIGSLVNLKSVSKKAIELAQPSSSDIYILPAGFSGDETVYTVEDWLTGVLIARQIVVIDSKIELVNGDLIYILID